MFIRIDPFHRRRDRSVGRGETQTAKSRRIGIIHTPTSSAGTIQKGKGPKRAAAVGCRLCVSFETKTPSRTILPKPATADTQWDSEADSLVTPATPYFNPVGQCLQL